MLNVCFAPHFPPSVGGGGGGGYGYFLELHISNLNTKNGNFLVIFLQSVESEKLYKMTVAKY